MQAADQASLYSKFHLRGFDGVPRALQFAGKFLEYGGSLIITVDIPQVMVLQVLLSTRMHEGVYIEVERL
jgi:hypothetical protein